MRLEDLKNFPLAGGTALAIQFGHRTSVDLDFFGNTEMSTGEIMILLDNEMEVEELLRSKSIHSSRRHIKLFSKAINGIFLVNGCGLWLQQYYATNFKEVFMNLSMSKLRYLSVYTEKNDGLL